MLTPVRLLRIREQTRGPPKQRFSSQTPSENAAGGFYARRSSIVLAVSPLKLRTIAQSASQNSPTPVMGVESVDAENLRRVHKSFNKPADYKLVLDRVAQRGIFAITLRQQAASPTSPSQETA